MSGSGKCWPDIKRRFHPSNNKDFGAQVRLPLNLPATTWRFYAVVNVECKGGWEEEGERIGDKSVGEEGKQGEEQGNSFVRVEGEGEREAGEEAGERGW